MTKPVPECRVSASHGDAPGRCGPRRSRILALLALGILPLLHARLACADDAEEWLRRLGVPDPVVHAEALVWWEEREPAEQVAILRRALASEDTALASLAAEAVGAEYLDQREMRRQMELLLARPLSVFEWPTTRRSWGIGGELYPWGSPDVVPFFRHVVEMRPLVGDATNFDAWHKFLRPRHIEGLVPLLDQGSPEVFRSVLWHVAMCGEYDHEDRYRAEVARGLLYGLERLRAERAGTPVPALEEDPVEIGSPPGGGLPDAYLALAACFYPRGGVWKVRLDADGPPVDLDVRSVYFWLLRWARDLTPSAKDLPYLRDVVTEGAGPMLLRWAMGHMAEQPGAGGIDQVRTWAAGDDERAAYAAAALAERGEPQRFLALLGAAQTAEGRGRQSDTYDVLADLLWAVDRSRARDDWVADALTTDPASLTSGDLLDADGRFAKERFRGIVVTDEDMEWIASALWARGAATPTLAWFFGTVWPEGITAERAEALRERLRDLAPGSLDRGCFEYVRPLLAMLEVRDEAGVAALLGRWVDTQPAILTDVLEDLASLGDTEHAAAMVDDWEQWGPDERRLLGRVVSPTVRSFLEAQAAAEDAEHSRPAVAALLMQAGLPDACARELLERWLGDLDVEPLPEIARLLREGDAAGAVWRAALLLPPHLLGLVRDERVRGVLEDLRVDRARGQWLEATVGLAVAGEAEAQQDVRSFLEDDRYWMIAELSDDAWSFLADPWMVEHWVGRLDSNCCLGWRSMVALRSIFPTIPFEDGYGGAGTVRTRAWIRSHRFARSRILDGLVPAGS